jgi:hypothetical protein
MAGYKVKIFNGSVVGEMPIVETVEQKINTWLTEAGAKITICGVSTAVHVQNKLAVTIWYTEQSPIATG